MFLKNYTSNVPVAETLHRIEQCLIKAGVTGIMKQYGPNSKVVAVTFEIQLPDRKPYMIRLPANEEKAINALWMNYADGDKLTADGQRIESWYGRKKKCRKDFVEQGERTAWKIMQDWIEVQISMIQMEQADTLEVFMPYIWDGQQTVYQRIQKCNYVGLLPETSGN